MSHVQCMLIDMDYTYMRLDYWGEPERAPHLPVVDVYVGASHVHGS